MKDNSINQHYPFSFISERFLEGKHKLNIVLIWAAIVGSLTGLVAVFFRQSVNFLISQRTEIIYAVKNIPLANWLISSFISGIMVYLSFWLMRRFAPDTSGSGIPQIEGFLDGIFPLNWQRVLPVKLFGGILALGGGMVGGFEGPTIQIGGSIGSMVGSLVKVSQENKRILVVAGAAAGLTAAFNAPIAGILLVTEEMRPKFNSWIVPYRAVMIACVMATISMRLLNGQEAFLKITTFTPIPLTALWMFVILGIALGIMGYIFNFCLFRALDWFGKLRGLAYKFTGLGVGVTIGFLAWLSPLITGSEKEVLTGSGDETILWGFNSEAPGYLLLLVFFLRFVLLLFCYGSGANGGIFAPMLSIATLFSLGLARELFILFPNQISEPAVFAVAGMGGLVAATVRAPLTAIMLTVELTNNFSVILPLLITCIIASITAHLMGGEPVYSVLLKRAIAKAEKLPETDFI